MATKINGLTDVVNLTRTYSDWSSTKGLRTDILPWRLWEKSKQQMWDPADIDYSVDARDFRNLSEEQQIAVSGLARGFMVGEEGVTLDILPLVLAIADEGRAEETMFLTTFLFEEAKHVDFFRRWFDAVGADPIELERKGRERAVARGQKVPPWERPRGMFEYMLPRVMRRLLGDRSAEAFMDASVTYNQFVEGCLAIAGYKLWEQMFSEFGVLPGLQKGLRLVQRDERRHIAYGTYLCRRLIFADPELAEFGTRRMVELRDNYFMQLPGPAQTDDGEGGYGSGAADDIFPRFTEMVLQQVERRIDLLERAREVSAAEAESGEGAEELEEELQGELTAEAV